MENMKESKKGKRPDYSARTVLEINEKEIWSTCGVGFQNKDTISVYLNTIPLNGKLILIPRGEDNQEQPKAPVGKPNYNGYNRSNINRF